LPKTRDTGISRIMSSNRARSGLLAAALLCGTVSASPAAAQTATEEDPRAEAGRRFDQGVAYYNEGRYDAALAEFLRAYDLTGEWTILYNLGQVSYALGRNAAALDYLQRYVDEGGEGVDAERGAEVQRLIAELEPRVARLVIEVDIDGATIVVDGQERGTTPLAGPVVVEPGSHVVEVRDGRRAGGRERREVILAGGLTETVRVAALAPVLPPPTDVPVAPPLPPTDEEASVWSSWWLWTIVGVVVVGGAVTAGVLLWPRDESYTEGTVPPIVLGLGSW
jgi:hypothetical protein